MEETLKLLGTQRVRENHLVMAYIKNDFSFQLQLYMSLVRRLICDM